MLRPYAPTGTKSIDNGDGDDDHDDDEDVDDHHHHNDDDEFKLSSAKGARSTGF